MTVMKRTALALLLCLLAFAATAQNVTVIGPITPGHCAAFSSTTVLKDCGGVPPVGPGTSVVNDIAIFANTTGSLLADATGFSITPGGPLTINPTASTLNQGLVITQTSPSASAAGPLSFNLINVTNTEATTGGGAVGALLNTNSSALRVNMTVGGANLAGQATSAGIFQILETIAGETASTPDKIGLIASAYSNVSNGGAGSGLYGMNPIAWCAVGCTTNYLVGYEADMALFGTASFRAAIKAVNQGTGVAGTLDAAIVVASTTGNGAGAFQKLIAFSQVGSFAAAPMSTTGDFFFSDTAMTVGSIFNLPNVTVTSNILSFPNVALTGGGELDLGRIGAVAGVLKFANATSGTLAIQPPAGALGSSVLTAPAVTDTLATRTLLQSTAVLFASLPTCNAGAKGLRYFVTDQATAVAYHGAVTGSGAFQQGVTCDGSAWYQD